MVRFRNNLTEMHWEALLSIYFLTLNKFENSYHKFKQNLSYNCLTFVFTIEVTKMKSMSKSPVRDGKTKNMKLPCTYLINGKINWNCFEIDRDICYDKKEHKKIGNNSAPVVGETYVYVKNDQIRFLKTNVQYCY